MKILFSPSEAKNENACINERFRAENLLFKNLADKRREVIKIYERFIKNEESLNELFGIKDEKILALFKQNLSHLESNKTAAAILLYSGVSYEFLSFETLDEPSKKFIFENVIIFSNLFGPIKASDKVPFYKLKQGFKFANFKLESFYKEHFSAVLDEYLKDEEIIDLRAGFYEKFYIPNQKYITYKFLKNNKIISHFAKAYKGSLLRLIALKKIRSNEELLANLSENLRLKEIKTIKNKTEITLEILD